MTTPPTREAMPTTEEIIDLIWEGIQNRMDCDTTPRDWAEGAYEEIKPLFEQARARGFREGVEGAIREISCGGCYGKCMRPGECRMDEVAELRALLPADTSSSAIGERGAVTIPVSAGGESPPPKTPDAPDELAELRAENEVMRSMLISDAVAACSECNEFRPFKKCPDCEGCASAVEDRIRAALAPKEG